MRLSMTECGRINPCGGAYCQCKRISYDKRNEAKNKKTVSENVPLLAVPKEQTTRKKKESAT